MKPFELIAGVSLKLVRVFVFIMSALVIGGTIASAADLNYVTGGSINLAYGTSAIHVRRATSTDGGDEHAFYLTFGGPAIKLSFPDRYFTATASFFPSLRYVADPDGGTNKFSVALGFGPSFGYKNWIVSLPVYFPDAKTTDFAIGIGYSL